MAYEIFFDIIKETYDYDNRDELNNLWELVNMKDDYPGQAATNILSWCEEQLDLLCIPEGVFRKQYIKALQYTETLDALVEWIYGFAQPEESSDAE